jgi:hypothetical protein
VPDGCARCRRVERLLDRIQESMIDPMDPAEIETEGWYPEVVVQDVRRVLGDVDA